MSSDLAVAAADARVGAALPIDGPADGRSASELPGVRVLHVGPALSVKGGVSSVERLILSELYARVDAAHIATTCDGGAVAKARCFARAIAQLRRELQAHDKLIVHVHFASRGSTWRKLIVARLAFQAGARLVLHAHGGGFDQFLRKQPARVQQWIRATFQRADLFVVLSTYWRNFYAERLGIEPNRIRVLWNPTRVTLEVPDRSGRERVHFVYLGMISHAKGAFDLIEAVRGLPVQVQQRLRLTMAGNGEIERLRATAAGLQATVDIRSWITEAQRDELLASADVYVLPSYFEGVPMSILEAMAAGVPVISTRVGGIPEIVAHEQTGVLVEAGNVLALRAQLQRLAGDEALRLQWGRAARRSAERFDVRLYGRELIENYRSLVCGVT